MTAREAATSTEQNRDYDAQLALARAAFRSFLEELDRKERIVVLTTATQMELQLPSYSHARSKEPDSKM